MVVPTELQAVLQQVEEAVAATVASKAPETLAKQLQAMRVPTESTWFMSEFGKENGAKIESGYAESTRKAEDELVKYFVQHGELGDR